MTYDPVQLRQMAESRADENFEFRDFLKHGTRLTSKEVDSLVARLEQKAWQHIDCTKCGNCCREVSPTLNDVEVQRLSCHLDIRDSEFISKYLKPAESTESSPWIMRERPCPFLKDNRCTVYAHRPDNCRDYPYLNKPAFTSRTLSMINRLYECPAVFEAWEELKKATGFRRRHR